MEDPVIIDPSGGDILSMCLTAYADKLPSLLLQRSLPMARIAEVTAGSVRDLQQGVPAVAANAGDIFVLFPNRAAAGDATKTWKVTVQHSRSQLPNFIPDDYFSGKIEWSHWLFSAASSEDQSRGWTFKVAVCCRSRRELDLCDRFLEQAARLYRVFSFAAIDSQLDRLSRQLIRVAALFPTASDEDVAYELLKQTLTAIDPATWTQAALWRTSRRSQDLEKIAELNAHKRPVARMQLGGWKLPPTRRAWESTASDQALRLPGIIVIRRLRSRPSAAKAALLLGRRKGDDDHRPDPISRLVVPVIRDDPFEANWPARFGFSSEQARKDLQQALALFLGRQPCLDDNVSLLIAAEAGFRDKDPPRSDTVGPQQVHLENRIPGPFQMVLALSLEAVPVDVSRAVLEMKSLCDKTVPAFDIVSMLRFQLRSTEALLTELHAVKHESRLRTVLGTHLQSLLGVRAWLILNQVNGAVTLASDNLANCLERRVDLGKFRADEYSAKASIDENDPAWLRSIRTQVMVEVQRELADRTTGAAKLPKTLGASSVLSKEIYGSIGYLMQPISHGRTKAILVLFRGCKWNVSATERMTCSLLNDAVMDALERTRAKPKRVPGPVASPVDLVKIEHEIVSFAGSAADFAQHFLKVARDALGFGGALLCAADQDAEVLKPMARMPAATELPGDIPPLLSIRDNSSLAGLAVTAAKTLVGLRISGSERLQARAIDDPGFEPREVLYQNWLPNVQTALAIPLKWQGIVRGVLVFGWGAEFSPATLKARQTLAANLAEWAQMWFTQTTAAQFWKCWAAIGPGINALRTVPQPALFADAKPIDVSLAALPPLPPELGATYSPAFQDSLREVLRMFHEKLDLASATLRMKHENPGTEQEALVLIAASEDWLNPAIAYDPGRSVLCYCVDRAGRDPGEELTVVSVPLVTRVDLLQHRYPNLHYRSHRDSTKSELAIACTARGIPTGKTHCAFNFEARDAYSLWLDRDLIKSFAQLCAAEVFARQIDMQRVVAQTTRHAMRFANWASHETVRAADDITELARKVMEVVAGDDTLQMNLRNITERADNLRAHASGRVSDGPAHSSIDTRELARHALVQAVANIDQASQVHVILEPVLLKDGCGPVSLDSQVENVLRWVMREQILTLSRLAQEAKTTYTLSVFLHRPEGSRHYRISLASDAPPIPREITPNLFWKRIGGDRPGRGAAGMGLAILGAMLRANGIFPVAHANSDDAPWDPLDHKSPHARFKGGWIELVINNRNLSL
jgi:hypothetical protein